MSVDENKAIMRRYLEGAWGNQDPSVAEEIVAEDVVFHDQVRAGDLPPGREGLLTVMERMFMATPDLTMHVHQLLAEGDMVVVRYTATGTHTGDFNGFPPTGRAVKIDGIAIARIEDGRIVEGWQEADELGLARGLGVMPKGQMPRPLAAALVAGIRLRDRLSRRGARTS
jgi:steroid delta-isomerase-like uncharacterized protein